MTDLIQRARDVAGRLKMATFRLASESRDDATVRRNRSISEAAAIIAELIERVEWQDIETAPKDGTVVLLLDKSDHYGNEPRGFAAMVARWVEYGKRDYRAPGGRWKANYGPCTASNPIAWMPLPQPPSVLGKQEG